MPGSPASLPRWVQGCAELFVELPADEDVKARHERTAFTACTEDIGAFSLFCHVCRLERDRPTLDRTRAEMSPVVLRGDERRSEFTVTERFRDWDIFDRLGRVGVPRLVMSGVPRRALA